MAIEMNKFKDLFDDIFEEYPNTTRHNQYDMLSPNLVNMYNLYDNLVGVGKKIDYYEDRHRSTITPSPVQYSSALFNTPSDEEAPRESREPSAIYTTFSTDLNILTIHSAVRSKYAYRLKFKITGAREEWEQYIEDSRVHLENYIYIKTCPPEIDHNELLGVRLSVINRYIIEVNKYITVNAFMLPTSSNTCTNCGTENSPETVSEINGLDVCLVCGKGSVRSVKLAMFNDSMRSDATIRNPYDDMCNFIKRLDAFEGKQKNRPPRAIKEQISKYLDTKLFMEKGITVSCEEIRNMSSNSERKKFVSMSLLEDALNVTKNSAYYKDIELIANWVWGWKLGDLSQIRRVLIDDYIVAQKVYDEIKERESSLNINIRVIFHLLNRKYDCDLNDFKLISSDESRAYHRRMLSGIAAKTHLNFEPFF